MNELLVVTALQHKQQNFGFPKYYAGFMNFYVLVKAATEL